MGGSLNPGGEPGAYGPPEPGFYSLSVDGVVETAVSITSKYDYNVNIISTGFTVTGGDSEDALVYSWTYDGSSTFQGFSLTQNSTTVDYSIGDSLLFNTNLTIWSVASSITENTRILTLNNNIILNNSNLLTIEPDSLIESVRSATTYIPTISDQTIPDGIYLEGPQTIKGDSNLVPNNIRKNTVLFGIIGSLSPYTWQGADIEFVQDLGSQSYALSTTTYDSWTPSTSAKAIKSTTTLTTFVADMTTYEYIIKWETQADVVYADGTTMNTCPIRQVACLYSYIFKRPYNLDAVTSGTRTSNATISYSAPLTKYYNSSGNLAIGWTASYGIYPGVTSPTFSNATTDTPTVTVKTPTWNARCSTTYMSTTSASAIDATKTTLQFKAKLYRCAKGTFARGTYEDCITLFNSSNS